MVFPLILDIHINEFPWSVAQILSPIPNQKPDKLTVPKGSIYQAQRCLSYRHFIPALHRPLAASLAYTKRSLYPVPPQPIEASVSSPGYSTHCV